MPTTGQTTTENIIVFEGQIMKFGTLKFWKYHVTEVQLFKDILNQKVSGCSHTIPLC